MPQHGTPTEQSINMKYEISVSDGKKKNQLGHTRTQLMFLQANLNMIRCSFLSIDIECIVLNTTGATKSFTSHFGYREIRMSMHIHTHKGRRDVALRFS